MVGLAGVIAMETSVAAVTFCVKLPETAPRVAVIGEIPTEAPVTRPEESTRAIVEIPADQVTDEVISFVVLSEYTPVAVN